VHSFWNFFNQARIWLNWCIDSPGKGWLVVLLRMLAGALFYETIEDGDIRSRW
jgi:hypothetical protein